MSRSTPRVWSPPAAGTWSKMRSSKSFARRSRPTAQTGSWLGLHLRQEIGRFARVGRSVVGEAVVVDDVSLFGLLRHAGDLRRPVRELVLVIEIAESL